MYARSRLDLGWGDLLVGLFGGLMPGDADAEAAELAAGWDPQAALFLTLRTAWDALLAELALPAGSEVLVSAVNIPDMFDLLRHHELVPVPVDLDPETLAPDLGQLAERATDRTAMVLVAELLGARNDLDGVFAFAEERGVPVVLDLAQGWEGPDTPRDPRALAVLFSFGPIKTASALGGCLAWVSDDELRGRMVARARSYPLQTGYAAVAAKYLVMKTLSLPLCYRVFVVGCRLIGRSHDQVINASVLGLKGADYWAALRRRPSRALVGLLGRRLRRFTGRRLAERAAVGAELAASVPGCVLGRGAARSTYWLLGVVADDPDRLVERLRLGGFDATSGSSRLLPCEHPEHTTPHAAAAMSRVVYVPAYPELAPAARRRLADLLAAS